MSHMGRADQRCQLALELTHHRFHLAVAHLHHTGFNVQSFLHSSADRTTYHQRAGEEDDAPKQWKLRVLLHHHRLERAQPHQRH